MAYELGPQTPQTSGATSIAENQTGLQPVQRSDELVVDHKYNRQRTYKDVLAQRANPTDQVSTNSTSVEPKSTSPAESVTLSPAAAALARKEQAFRKEQAQLKLKEAEIAKERLEIHELRELKAKLANKDYSDLEKLAPYDEYTNYLIDKSGNTDPAQEEIKALKSEIGEVKKRQEEAVSKQFEAAVAQRRTAVNALVETNPDYSSIKEMNAQEAVVVHILETFEADGVDLSPEQAAKEVEEILLEKANKWLSLSKLKPKDTEQVVQKKQTLPPLKDKVTTLTNNMAPTGDIKLPKRSFEGMSDSQRYAEAKRRVQEKLKG